MMDADLLHRTIRDGYEAVGAYDHGFAFIYTDLRSFGQAAASF